MSVLEIMQKNDKLVIGLMGGTSADGVDAALVRIQGWGAATKLHLVAYESLPFPAEVRREILEITTGEVGGSRRICLLGGVLGQLYLQACHAVCQKAGVAPKEIDLIGSHGQTIFHQPETVKHLGVPVTATLQIGEPSCLCEAFDAVVVSDFRVRDMAAGGQGAPLVSYTEYLLYKDDLADIALQNIGGIGNITFLPQGGTLEEITAFDTGPGNLLMDDAAARHTGGKHTYDPGGSLAAQYETSAVLLQALMQDEYLAKAPPKTTGREYYNQAFLDAVYHRAAELGLGSGEVLRTLTRYTAQTISHAARVFLPRLPQKLIVGGGGSYNLTLLADLRELLPEVRVLTNEDLHLNGDAKEAVAFALLANEAIHGVCNNAPAATGARHAVVMGKISQ